MPANRKYADAEVRKILDLALRGEPDRGVSHDELVAIGSEVGVSRESIDAAARQLHLKEESEQLRQQVLRRRRRNLASHAFAFAIVNGFLFVINYLTSPGQWWVLFPIFAWGLGLIFHARFGLSRVVSARARLKAQRRAAREGRYDALAEQMELAALAKLSPHATNADGSVPRTRIDATAAASEADAGHEPQAEHGASRAEVGRRGD